MSSDVLRKLTEKKGKQLSKFLGIESVPDTRFIIKIQEKIKNPMFKLSMNDYEMLCGDKTMTKLMTKVFDCDVKQLKKFCKYINVFKDNINSSPESIKKKMKLTNSINASMRRGSLSVLPDDILEKIVNKYETLFSRVKYKLKDWIPPEKLDWVFLSANPNAIELLKENQDKIDWEFLSKNTNPNAIELLKSKINEENEMSEDDYHDSDKSNKINWNLLSANPNAIELLRENPDEIVWPNLSDNPNPNAIELLKENPDNIDWNRLSQNPNAIELLEAHLYNINWRRLSLNPHPRAIELLKANPKKIDWCFLSKNPNHAAIELLKANKKKIVWGFLSENPNPEAIELLKENQSEINWPNLSENPNPEAIELLRTNPSKIDWVALSANPAAIELLKANPKNIIWDFLSQNPAIFDEILE